ncbi:MAG TPA: hypothetical protein VH186_14070 [Chloroflexia bacterium]|nr:hypothetical protein [Chloroflexia bacterium]
MLEVGNSTLNLRDQTVGLDQHIPLLNGTSTTYINFDNAASTPPLRKVVDKVNDFIECRVKPRRFTPGIG